MCLLVALSRVRSDLPLVVAANRDEWLARPAKPMALLRERAPRILGGKDELAGGSWLAVNEHGVVAGLTNRPIALGRDPTKRSRGELPLRLARHRTAGQAVHAFLQEIRPLDYNPCWIFVGDRRSLFYLEIGEGRRAAAHELPPGVHILENRPLGAPSPKADRVRRALRAPLPQSAAELRARLARILSSHAIPTEARRLPRASQGLVRPLETHAACVHAGPYGTRSSELVLVPGEPARPPRLAYSRGPPCLFPFVDASRRWR